MFDLDIRNLTKRTKDEHHYVLYDSSYKSIQLLFVLELHLRRTKSFNEKYKK